MIHKLLALSVLAASIALPAVAQAQGVNAGERSASTNLPFAATRVAEFDTPWAIAMLPDGRMLVTQRPEGLFLVTRQNRTIPIGNVPKVSTTDRGSYGQNGLLDIAAAPGFRSTPIVYLSYVEPDPSGSRLALARARLSVTGNRGSLDDLEVVWRQTPEGGGGQPGGVIAFDPDGKHVFLTVGDRMEDDSAQDPNQIRGKIVRLNLDGSVPADNPFADRGGATAAIWTLGHRNPYGLAFAPDGRLWSHEMGPRGGDEFNLIEEGRNYGWPLVSNGSQYSGLPIPDHDTRPDLAAPALYWTPVVSPAGLVFYDGRLFPEWRGSALLGGLSSTALIRIAFDRRGRPDEVDRWDMGARIRDVAVAPDGSVWVIEDASPGRLLRLAPRR